CSGEDDGLTTSAYRGCAGTPPSSYRSAPDRAPTRSVRGAGTPAPSGPTAAPGRVRRLADDRPRPRPHAAAPRLPGRTKPPGRRAPGPERVEVEVQTLSA